MEHFILSFIVQIIERLKSIHMQDIWCTWANYASKVSQLSSVALMKKSVGLTHTTSMEGGNTARIRTICHAFALKIKPVVVSIHGQVARQSGRVLFHSGMSDCLSVLVCLCMQPNLQKHHFIINFGPLRFEYITAKGQSSQCQREHKNRKDERTSESQFYFEWRMEWTEPLAKMNILDKNIQN